MIFLIVAVVALVYLRPRLLANPPAVLARLPMLAPVPPSALTPPAPWRASAVHRLSPARSVLALGRVETRRLLGSPLFVVAFGMTVLNCALPGAPTEFNVFNAFAAGGQASLWCGLLLFFAGNLAGTRDRRNGTTETFGAAPLPPRLRVLALTVAALVAGAVLLAVFVAGWVYWWDVRELAVTRPGLAHLLSLPLQVVGGITLGVMVSTWAPWRGVAPAVVFALVAAHIALSNAGVPEWGAYLEYVRWPDQGGGFRPVSAAWHSAYLALLSAMAVVGALVWLPGRRRALLAFGAVLTLATFGAGLAQFP